MLNFWPVYITVVIISFVVTWMISCEEGVETGVVLFFISLVLGFPLCHFGVAHSNKNTAMAIERNKIITTAAQTLLKDSFPRIPFRKIEITYVYHKEKRNDDVIRSSCTVGKTLYSVEVIYKMNGANVMFEIPKLKEMIIYSPQIEGT